MYTYHIIDTNTFDTTGIRNHHELGGVTEGFIEGIINDHTILSFTAKTHRAAFSHLHEQLSVSGPRALWAVTADRIIKASLYDGEDCTFKVCK